MSVSESLYGLSNGISGKEPACQCRRCRRPTFDPWVGEVPWRRARQPSPVFLPGESSRQRSLAGYSPWGRAEWHTPEGTEQVVGTTQRTWCKVMFELLCVCVKQLEGWAGPSILLLSWGIRAGRSALPPLGAREHTWPQPLLTHFSPATQSWSPLHCSTQTPSRSEKTGLRHLNTMNIYPVRSMT